MNAYDVPRPSGYEDVRQFEFRVNQAIQKILEVPNEDLKVLVLHRSPITATLINFARQATGYPENYYGHIQLDLGYVSWITVDSQGKYNIRHVNISLKEMVEQEIMIGDSSRGCNPFIRPPAMAIPVEHRAKRISSTNDRSDSTVRDLVEAFRVESDIGLRKLIVLKLIELLDVEDVAQLVEQLDTRKLNLVQAEQFQQVLQWRVNY